MTEKWRKDASGNDSCELSIIMYRRARSFMVYPLKLTIHPWSMRFHFSFTNEQLSWFHFYNSQDHFQGMLFNSKHILKIWKRATHNLHFSMEVTELRFLYSHWQPSLKRLKIEEEEERHKITPNYLRKAASVTDCEILATNILVTLFGGALISSCQQKIWSPCPIQLYAHTSKHSAHSF